MFTISRYLLNFANNRNNKPESKKRSLTAWLTPKWIPLAHAIKYEYRAINTMALYSYKQRVKMLTKRIQKKKESALTNSICKY